MADWNNSILRIYVPKDNLQSLLDALKGPQEWQLPSAAKYSHATLDVLTLSAHDKIQLLADREEIEKAFRAHPARADYPEWMPLSMQDALDLLAGNIEPITECELSIPRLNPIADRAEFDSLLSGSVVDGYWAPRDPGDVFHRHVPIDYSLYFRKLGADSILHNIRRSQIKTPSRDGRVGIDFRFEIKNGILMCLHEVLPDLLKKFDAKAMHVWCYNGQSGGYDYIDPSTDTCEVMRNDAVSIFEILEDHEPEDVRDLNGDEEDTSLQLPDVCQLAVHETGDQDFDFTHDYIQ
jgi:hypothetical protein